MPKRAVTFEQAKRIGLGFPEVAESTSYGTPALKVRGRVVIRLKEDRETLVCRSNREERERRLALKPDVFFLTGHYRDHPWVLLRLSAATPVLLEAAIEHAWFQSAPRSLVAAETARREAEGRNHSASRKRGGREVPVTVAEFTTTTLRALSSEIAPDGSAVSPLLTLSGATMAHFGLTSGETSRAVVHRTVEEFWFVLSGKGELWRKQGAREEVVVLEPGICATIPRATHFQFRAVSRKPLAIVAVTIPRWPGDNEAQSVPGPWSSTAVPPVP